MDDVTTKPNDSEIKEEFDDESLTATQGLIARLSRQMDEVSANIKLQKEMLQGIFDNDEQLSQAKTLADEAKKTQKERQGNLNNQKEVKDLRMKISEFTEDLKTIKESLNTHLINYFQATGVMLVDMPGGEEREFTLTAKLKPAKKSE